MEYSSDGYPHHKDVGFVNVNVPKYNHDINWKDLQNETILDHRDSTIQATSTLLLKSVGLNSVACVMFTLFKLL